MTTPQAARAARNAALMRLCKAHRDTIATALPGAATREAFMEMTAPRKPGPRLGSKRKKEEWPWLTW
jgi:hypothetical protein